LHGGNLPGSLGYFRSSERIAALIERIDKLLQLLQIERFLATRCSLRFGPRHMFD